MQVSAVMAMLGLAPGKTAGEDDTSSGVGGDAFGQMLSASAGASASAVGQARAAATKGAEVSAVAKASASGAVFASVATSGAAATDVPLVLQDVQAQEDELAQMVLLLERQTPIQQADIQVTQVAAVVDVVPQISQDDVPQADTVSVLADMLANHDVPPPLVVAEQEDASDAALANQPLPDVAQQTLETVVALVQPDAASSSLQTVDDAEIVSDNVLATVAVQEEVQVSAAEDADTQASADDMNHDALAISQNHARDAVVVPLLLPVATAQTPQATAPLHPQQPGQQALEAIDNVLQRVERLPQQSSAADALVAVQQAMARKQGTDIAALHASLNDSDAHFTDALLAAQDDAEPMDDAELEAVIERLLGNRPALASALSQASAGAGVGAATGVQAAAPAAVVAINTALPEVDVATDTSGQGDDAAAALAVSATATTDAAHRPLSVVVSRADNSAAQYHAHSTSEQVQMGIHRAIADGQDTITIELKPKELGRVEVRLDISASGHGTIVFAVEKPETLDMLQRDARQLQQMLRDAGVQTGAGDMQFNLQQQAQQDAAQDDSGFGSYPGRNDATSETQQQPYVDALTGHYTIMVNDGVNIRV